MNLCDPAKTHLPSIILINATSPLPPQDVKKIVPGLTATACQDRGNHIWSRPLSTTLDCASENQTQPGQGSWCHNSLYGGEVCGEGSPFPPSTSFTAFHLHSQVCCLAIVAHSLSDTKLMLQHVQFNGLLQ